MRTIILAGVAAFALAVPATAQKVVAVDAEGDVLVLTDDQQVLYDTWPVERRTMYDAWPEEVKVYYWTLPANQAEGWWVLNPDQQMRIYRMTPAQRAAAWTSIAAQLNASATVPLAAASTNMRFVSTAMVQPIESDSPPVGELPICEPMSQDDCINGWEAGKRGPNVTKPLGYWPGKPASEIDTPLPAEDPND